ncbi:MAG: hypothetical protein J6386_18555 [Candidatus Synoicihabitans palmerolidicus]|nr:hypothetical protein [Candidatus Synoicihabitans palmerolidicus]
MKFTLRKTTSNRVTVVDVGVARVSSAVFSGSPGTRLRCEKWVSRPVPWADSWDDEPGLRLVDVLQEVRVGLGEEGASAHVICSGHLVLTKGLMLPVTAASQRIKMVAFEAPQAIPFPLEDVKT